MAIDTSNNYIYQQGSSPNTRVAISMKNRLWSTKYNGNALTQIGVLQSFNTSENRSVEAVKAIGFGDRIVELVPGVTEPMDLRFNRTLLYTSTIMQELGYAGGVDGLVRSLRQHRWPFDIQSELVFSELVQDVKNVNGPEAQAKNRAVITRFLACWLESYSVDFSSDNALIMEDAGGKATDVINGALYGQQANTYGENLASGNSPALPFGGSSIYRSNNG